MKLRCFTKGNIAELRLSPYTSVDFSDDEAILRSELFGTISRIKYKKRSDFEKAIANLEYGLEFESLINLLTQACELDESNAKAITSEWMVKGFLE